MSSASKFATSLCCIDGRIQLSIHNWLKEKHDVDFVDTITEPAIIKLFAYPQNNAMIKNKVLHSIKNNQSKLILVSGHFDCDFTEASKEKQISQIKDSIAQIKSWNLTIPVIGAWINEKSEVEQLE